MRGLFFFFRATEMVFVLRLFFFSFFSHLPLSFQTTPQIIHIPHHKAQKIMADAKAVWFRGFWQTTHSSLRQISPKTFLTVFLPCFLSPLLHCLTSVSPVAQSSVWVVLRGWGGLGGGMCWRFSDKFLGKRNLGKCSPMGSLKGSAAGLPGGAICVLA